MTDPFRIVGPPVISFSGGRTSGYMLWRTLQAHGGTLPDDVVVCFANTGREMPATLDFVNDCAAHFGVHVHWLEYRWTRGVGPSVAQEAVPRGDGTGHAFRSDREGYAALARTTRDQGVIPFLLDEFDPCTDAVCGV